MAKNSTKGSFEKLYNSIEKSVEKTVAKAILDGTESANQNTSVSVNPSKIVVDSIDISKLFKLTDSGLEEQIDMLLDKTARSFSESLEKQLVAAFQIAIERGIYSFKDAEEKGFEEFSLSYEDFAKKSQKKVRDYYKQRNNNNTLNNVIDKWQQQDITKTNERYTAFNSKTLKTSGEHNATEAEDVAGKLIRSAIQEMGGKADGFLHSHPTNIAAFSDTDIEEFYRLYSEGISKQIVIGFKQAISLDMDNLDTSKSEEVLSILKEEYDKAKQEIGTNFLRKNINQISNISDEIFDGNLTGNLEVDNIIGSAREKYHEALKKIGDKITLDDYEDLVYNALTEAFNESSISKKKNTKNFSIVKTFIGDLGNSLLESLGDIEENKDALQSRFQSILLDVFSNPNYLKKGVKSAIKVQDLADFIKSPKTAFDFSDILSEATTPSQTDQITEAEQSVDDFANGVIEQFGKRTSDMENAAQKAGDSVSEAFNKAVNENKGQTLKDIENAYDSNGKLAQKAGNLKQLREQYNRLRNINHDIEVLENPDNYVTSSNGHKDFVGIGQKKTGLGLDELKVLKKEIIELNPQLQELEDRTERIKKSDFEQRFEHTFSDFIDKEIDNSIPEEFYEQYRKIIDEYREGKTSAEEATIAAKNLREEIEKGVPDDKTLISSDDIVDDLEVEIKTAQEATEAIEKKNEAEREAPSAKALSERIYSRIRNKSVDDFSTEEFAKLEQKVNETISEMERFGYNTDKVKARWESFKQSVDEGIDTSKTQQQAIAATNSELELVAAMDKVDKEKADDTANQVTEQSAKLTAEEAQAMADLFDKALKAAEAKEKFAGANKGVLESIISSLSALNSEGKGFENLNNLINNLARNKDDRITDMVANLELMRDALNTPIENNSFIKAIQELASQGDSLKDLATVLKATQSQINKAKQSIKSQSSTNPVSPVQSDQKDVRGTSHNQQYDSQGNVTREVSSFTVRNQSGRNTRYTRTTNSQTGEIQYAIHETTDYNNAINDTVTAIIRARKVQHDLNLEWEKTKPNQDRINALTDELSDYYRVIRQATQAAHDFEQENADWYNDTATGSKYGQQQHFTDYVRQRVTQGIAKEDERYASYISKRNEKLIRQVDNDIFTAQFELDNGDHTEAFNDKLRDIITNLETIKKTRPDTITERQVELAREYSDELKKANKEGKLSANNKANENSILKNLGQINELLSGNTKLSFRNTDVYRDLINLQNEFKNFNTSRPQSELKDLTTRFLEVKSRFNELSETFKGDNLFITFIKRLHSTTAQLIAQYFSFQDIIRYVRSMATTIIDLDTQLVDLRKTTTMTTTELERFYNSSSEVAKQLGVTTSEIISQASAWSRLGYSSQEAATKMAKLSSQFASISPGMDTESATDALVSTMQAYKIGVEDVQRTVMDNINAIGNTMATTNSEIGEMLQRSSAAMKAANNTLEETIALESAAVEIKYYCLHMVKTICFVYTHKEVTQNGETPEEDNTVGKIVITIPVTTIVI